MTVFENFVDEKFANKYQSTEIEPASYSRPKICGAKTMQRTILRHCIVDPSPLEGRTFPWSLAWQRPLQCTRTRYQS